MHYLKNATSAHTLFWFGLFIPLSVVFQALCFFIGSLRPNADFPVAEVILVKSAYFGMVALGIFALKHVWQSVNGLSSRKIIWTYRLLALASLIALLMIHSQSMYQFGRIEREMQRNMTAANKAFPSSPIAGVRFDRIRLKNRDWIQELTMTEIQATQINKDKFGAAIRPMLSSAMCAEPWSQHLLESQIQVRYVIRDRNGELIADEAFSADACSRKP